MGLTCGEEVALWGDGKSWGRVKVTIPLTLYGGEIQQMWQSNILA